MGSVKLTRVDSRLIHGQVMARWVMDLKINKIVVIDDNTFKNPVLAKVLKMAVPSGIEVSLFNVDGATQAWKENQFGDGDKLLLFKDISSAKRVYEQGIDYGKLQIGGVGGSPDKKKAYKNVSISLEEFELLKQMTENNVNVYLQPIPEDKPYSFESVMKDNIF